MAADFYYKLFLKYLRLYFKFFNIARVLLGKKISYLCIRKGPYTFKGLFIL